MVIRGWILNDVICTEVKLNVAESASQYLLRLARNLNSYPSAECVFFLEGITFEDLCSKSPPFNGRSRNNLDYFFLCMPFALTKDKRSKRQFFKVLNGGQFILSVDNTRLSFFMDPTSELFILSNKG